MTRDPANWNLGVAGRPQVGLTWPALVVVLVPPFMAVVDGFIVIVAIPTMQRQLHASDGAMQLVMAGYVAAYASCLVAGGWLGDRYGRRKLLVIALGLFTAFSLICALAPDERVLIVARCMQGAAAALLYPQSLALIRANSADERDLIRAIGAWGVTLGLAAVGAQLLGGLLIQADPAGLGWRTVFLVNVPVGVVVAGLVGIVPESRARVPENLDLAGMAMLTAGLFALVLTLTAARELGWPGWTWLTFGGSVALGRLLAVHEVRLASSGGTPLLALDLFQRPAVACGLLTTLILYAGQLSFWVLATWYLQRGLGLTPLATGAMMASASVGFFTTSAVVSRLSPRVASKLPSIGAFVVAMSAAGLGVMAVAVRRPTAAATVLLLFLVGAGLGAIIPALAATILGALPEDGEGVASGVLVTAQQAAAAAGVALTGVLVSGLLRGGVSYTRSLGLALVFDAGLFLITAVLARSVARARAS